MKPDDKDKLNQCLDMLDTTDLGLSMVWLWTWSTIGNILDDETYNAKVTKDDMWEHLCKAVEEGRGFSLEYGAEQHQEDVLEWMTDNDWIKDSMFTDDEGDEDELDTDESV